MTIKEFEGLKIPDEPKQPMRCIQDGMCSRAVCGSAEFTCEECIFNIEIDENTEKFARWYKQEHEEEVADG